MCVMCDGVAPDEFLAQQRQRIENCGFTMMAVEPNDDHPPWLYTIGLVEHDHPELAVVGLPLTVASTVVHELAHRVIDGESYLPPQPTLEMIGVPNSDQSVDLHLEWVAETMWDGPMFNMWHAYYEWLGASPERWAVELVPSGSQPTGSWPGVVPLAAARPRRAARRARSASRYRPLSA